MTILFKLHAPNGAEIGFLDTDMNNVFYEFCNVHTYACKGGRCIVGDCSTHERHECAECYDALSI